MKKSYNLYIKYSLEGKIIDNYYTRLKDLREDRDLTQAQVAEIIQTSQQHYGKYESGKIVIPFDRVIILARYYGVSIDYIAGLTNEPVPLNANKSLPNSKPKK